MGQAQAWAREQHVSMRGARRWGDQGEEKAGTEAEEPSWVASSWWGPPKVPDPSLASPTHIYPQPVPPTFKVPLLFPPTFTLILLLRENFQEERGRGVSGPPLPTPHLQASAHQGLRVTSSCFTESHSDRHAAVTCPQNTRSH